MRKSAPWLGLAILFTAATAFASPEDDFMASDQNNDRRLQPDEFRTFIDLRADAGTKAAQRVRAMRAYGIAFDLADADQSGGISGDELRAMVNAN